jgi:predicted NACHT family NTPase
VPSLKHSELRPKAVAEVILKQELYVSTSFDMAEQDYNWKRFWCPRSSQINLGDRGGYLYDPEPEERKFHNPDLVELKDIADIPCLVLLGEPGLGKSKTVEKEHKRISQADGEPPMVLNLHAYGSEDRLVKKLFESQQFSNWVQGDHHLYVFLDSLDECLLRIENLTKLLAEEFKQYEDKTDRLFLRIVCRTAVWQTTFEEQLRQIWGKDQVKIYELAPLRWKDVRHAAEREEIADPDIFLQEICNKNIIPLAIKPITLIFLLKIYCRDGQFTENQPLCDLYLKGCRILCDEEDDADPRRPGHKENLDLDQRLIIAARIAAVTVFANRDAVWMGRESGQIPEDDVLRRELALGFESINEKQIEVSEAKITEVLDTGLFSSRGVKRIGWAHQTYAEFLAAWYLRQHNLHLSQILNLIYADQRVIPQLQETAAWLASMIPEVFQAVMKTDPDVLLQSDISTIDNDNKAKLVKSLLQLHDEKNLAYSYFHILRYKNLDYLGLAEQLQPYILKSTKSIWTRYVAIDIAKACQVKDVQNSLVDLVLDFKQDYQLRVHAITAACHLCDEDTKSRLKSLAIDNIEHDPEDDLKGYALQAVYPNHVSTEEVLNNLKSPERDGFGGSYQKFLTENFVEYFHPADLLTALNWLERQPTVRELNHPFDTLSDSILQKAWEHIEDSKILFVFARIIFLRIQKSDAIVKSNYSEFKQQLVDDDNKRRKLISEVIPLLPESDQYLWVSLIDIENNQLALLPQDSLWLSEQLAASESEHVRNIYEKLIHLQPHCTENQVQKVAVFCPKIKVNGFAHSTDNSDLSEVLNFVDKDNLDHEVLELIEYCLDHNIEIKPKLTENHLAKLYIFLEREYLEKQESDNKSDRKSTLKGVVWRVRRPVDTLKHYKNYILQWLQELGPSEACKAFREIIRELPELADELQWRLLKTEEAARRITWNPPRPEDILQIVRDRDKRLVQDGCQLLQVLIESLIRLELELQGETPAARDVWDKCEGSLFKPIDENAFSDYVKRFLDKDLKSRGIIVNREVELRRKYGGSPGERTDIHVDAVLKRPNGETYDSITVIIEVKGCWHPEVKTAMESQLVSRYLADSTCKYGLYLIGWFDCQQWDSQDSRKSKTSKMTIDEAKTQFDRQAETLSSSGNAVRAYVMNTALR